MWSLVWKWKSFTANTEKYLLNQPSPLWATLSRIILDSSLSSSIPWNNDNKEIHAQLKLFYSSASRHFAAVIKLVHNFTVEFTTKLEKLINGNEVETRTWLISWQTICHNVKYGCPRLHPPIKLDRQERPSPHFKNTHFNNKLQVLIFLYNSLEFLQTFLKLQTKQFLPLLQ